ncbi:MAG: methyltransferase domain-containing protein [Deltaproteobacteria bacterium]|nr:methyltransferase domain-containing protein [Deltaproteobacteria bacterium]
MNISPETSYYRFLKPIYVLLRFNKPFSLYFKYLWAPVKTRIKLITNSRKTNRRLEIGTDCRHPIQGFESLSIETCVNIDYALDASKKLPFKDNTFSLIYSSHTIEHIPWYQTVSVLKEWKRILKSGGSLEIWVPDGLKICRNLVRVEDGGDDESGLDGYYNLVPNRDPRLWASLRIFTYGDARGTLNHPNWHRAIFTPSLLLDSLRWAGFENVEPLGKNHVRGRDHGWINLGAKGVKP